MTEVVFRRVRPLANLRMLVWSTCSLLMSAPCLSQTPQTPTTQASPQIVTVQAPAQSAPVQTTSPDWGQAQAQAQTANRNTANASQTYVNDAPDPPSEFQQLVSRTVGVDLPIFGSNLFRNAPSTFAPVVGQVTPDYVIGPGDEIRLSATGQLNQQGSFVVDRGGTISIPDVGTLTVSGLRFDELKPFLERQLGRVYRNFQLNVTLGQTRAVQVYVTGAARRPGAYTISAVSTLLNAVFASGGVLPQGSLRTIQLLRGRKTVATFDLYDLLLRGDKSHDVPLQPGDVIFIPRVGPQVAAVGSVTTPAIYELNGETSVAQLLTLANGATSTALESNARVESIYNHAERTVTEVNLRTDGGRVLHDGDILTVSAISGQFREAVTLRGNVTFPGRYTWRTGLHVSDVIPNREALLTRGFYTARNALGQPQSAPAAYANQRTNGNSATQAAGMNAQTGGTANTPANAQPNATPAAPVNGAAMQTDGTTMAATQAGAREVVTDRGTTGTTANSNGSGTSVGDALTQNNSGFPAANSVVLIAPDVDLSYAVIERLDLNTMTTFLVPFNLGRMLAGDASQNVELQAGDVITVFSKADIRVPQSQQTRFVRLEGEFVSSGIYSVLPGETLRQLVARAGGLTPDAYLYASEFTRESTRRIEQQRLREFADTLEAQISTQISNQVAGNATATGGVDAVAQTANAAATSGRQLVNRLRNAQPSGRIVLKLQPTSAGLESVPDIALEDGDRFIIPRQPSTVAVSGEVYNASAFLFEPGMEVRQYLRVAGGPQRDADEKRIFLVRADGSVVSRQYNNVERAQIFPGDTIVVPPRLTHSNLLRNILLISSVVGSVATPLSVIALLARN